MTEEQTVPDNVEETAPAPEKKQLSIELYDMGQAVERVIDHYERSFKEISFRFPTVVTDGSIVEFIDLQTNAVMAKFVLRILNAVNIDEKTGQMSMPVMFSSMMAGASLNARTINIDLKPKKQN